MSEKSLQPPVRLIEQLEVLKLRVMSALNGQASGPAVLAFTSVRSGEGVTSIAANFAATIAGEEDRKVLLVDGDLRRPSLHSLFRKKDLAALGVTEPEAPVKASDGRDLDLTGPAWKVVPAQRNLDVLLARRRIDDPGRLFGLSQFEDFLAEAKERYQMVVIDCPPIQGSSGATILSAKADAVVLVIESGKVRFEVINRALGQLEETGANILGVVLNKRRHPIPNFVYKRL